MNKNCIRGLLAAAIVSIAAHDANAEPTRTWKSIDAFFYPADAIMRGIEGQVLVEFNVDDQGRISGAKVTRGAPKGVFGREVATKVETWRLDMESLRAANRPIPHAVRLQFQIAPCADGPFYFGADDALPFNACASEFPGRKLKDSVFIDAILKEQRSLPEYTTALSETVALENELKDERIEVRPAGAERALKTRWLLPVIPPSFRRAGNIGAAIVTFSITGAGRARDLTAVQSGTNAELTTALTQAVSSWLFEPAIDGSTGIAKTGYIAVLTVGTKDPKTHVCTEPQLAGKPDFEVHVCFLPREMSREMR